MIWSQSFVWSMNIHRSFHACTRRLKRSYHSSNFDKVNEQQAKAANDKAFRFKKGQVYEQAFQLDRIKLDQKHKRPDEHMPICTWRIQSSQKLPAAQHGKEGSIIMIHLQIRTKNWKNLADSAHSCSSPKNQRMCSMEVGRAAWEQIMHLKTYMV